MAEEFDIFDGWISTDGPTKVFTKDTTTASDVRLIIDDVTSALSKLKSEGEQFDAIVTDPPYKVNISHWDKEMPPAEVWMDCIHLLKPGGHLIIFGQPSMSMDLFEVMMEAKYRLNRSSSLSFTYRDTWIWAYQGTHTKGILVDNYRSRIRNVYNPIYVFRKELEGTEEENWNKYGTNLLNIDSVRQQYKGDHFSIQKKFEETGEKHLQSETKSNTFGKLERKGWVPDVKGAEPTNIQYCPRATRAERTLNGAVSNEHETVKPLGIMLWLLELVTHKPGQSVLDCFMGSGSTGMACKLLGRKFTGIDNNPEMESVANYRINNVFELDSTMFKRKPV